MMEVTPVSNVPHPQHQPGAQSPSPDHINANSEDTTMLVSDSANAASPPNPPMNGGNISSILTGAGNETIDGNSLETSNALKRKREDSESVDKTDAEKNPEKSKAMRLTSHLVLCLQYAKLKVEHGWHKESFAQVERLYFGDKEVEGMSDQSNDRQGTNASGNTVEQREFSTTSGTNSTASVPISHPNLATNINSDSRSQFSSTDYSFTNRSSTTPTVQTSTPSLPPVSASSSHRKSRSKPSKQSQPRPISLPPHSKSPSQLQSQSRVSGSPTANQVPDTDPNAIPPGPPTSSLSSHLNTHASAIPSYPASVSTPVPPSPPPPVPVYASPFDAVAATYPDAFSPSGTSSSSQAAASSNFPSLPTHPVKRSINLSNGLNAFSGNLNTLSAFNQYHQHNQKFQSGSSSSNPSSSLTSLSLLPTLTYDSFWNSHSHTTSSLPTSSSNLFSRSFFPSSASSSLPSLHSSSSALSGISPLPGSGNGVRTVAFRTSSSGAGTSTSETGAASATTKGGATGLTARTILDTRISFSPTSGSSSTSGSAASKGLRSGADSRLEESRANSGVRVVRRAFDTPTAINSMGPSTVTRNSTEGLNHPTLPPGGYPVNFSIPISAGVSTVVANGGGVGTRS